MHLRETQCLSSGTHEVLGLKEGGKLTEVTNRDIWTSTHEHQVSGQALLTLMRKTVGSTNQPSGPASALLSLLLPSPLPCSSRASHSAGSHPSLAFTSPRDALGSSSAPKGFSSCKNIFCSSVCVEAWGKWEKYSNNSEQDYSVPGVGTWPAKPEMTFFTAISLAPSHSFFRVILKHHPLRDLPFPTTAKLCWFPAIFTSSSNA